MTTQPGAVIPQFTQGDRLRKARQLTGLTTRQFADEIGVSQVTITNAENDNTKVRKITLNAWSMRTGVPREWLETGESPHPGGPDGGLEDERARRDSNPKPSDPKVATLLSITGSQTDGMAA